MTTSELSPENQALLRAFAEVVMAECADRPWEAIEPTLASCWAETFSGRPPVPWASIAPALREFCCEPRLDGSDQAVP